MFLYVQLHNLNFGTMKAFNEVLQAYDAKKEKINTIPLNQLRQEFMMAGQPAARADALNRAFRVLLSDTRNIEAMMDSLNSNEMRSVVDRVRFELEVSEMPVQNVLKPPFPSA